MGEAKRKALANNDTLIQSIVLDTDGGQAHVSYGMESLRARSSRGHSESVRYHLESQALISHI